MNLRRLPPTLLFIGILVLPCAAQGPIELELTKDSVFYKHIKELDSCDITQLKVTGDISWLGTNASSLALASADDKLTAKQGEDLAFDISEIAKATDIKEGKADVMLRLRYVGAPIDHPWAKALTDSVLSLVLQLSGCREDGIEQEQVNQEAFDTQANDLLVNKYQYVLYSKNGVYIKDDVVHVFIDHNGNLIKGTKFPTILNEKDKYNYRVVIFADQNHYDKDHFLARVEGSEFSSTGGIVIYTGGDITASADKKLKLVPIESDVYGPFSNHASFRVYRRANKEKPFIELIFERTTKLESNRPYDVAILGGFYYSSLNNPENVVKGVMPNTQDSTLYADNPSSQRALTIMAAFYPRPRDRGYLHENLMFMQKWGVVFGVKLSEDLFDNLLLGLNYEFSKGGSFSLGTHFGKHHAVRGYEDFEFGKTLYRGPFDNDQLSEVWDFGFFAGVTIDLAILGALRRAAQNERDANNNTSNSNNP